MQCLVNFETITCDIVVTTVYCLGWSNLVRVEQTSVITKKPNHSHKFLGVFLGLVSVIIFEEILLSDPVSSGEKINNKLN